MPTLQEVRDQFGDEVDLALSTLRGLKAEGWSVEKARDQLRGEHALGVPGAGIAASLLVRDVVDYDNLPPVDDYEIITQAQVDAARALAEDARTSDSLVATQTTNRSLGKLWELQAALRLSKEDSNGLEILQIAVTSYLLDNGIHEPGLQEQFDRQQEEMGQ